MTQERLAERIDRTSDTISLLERGISLPSFDTLERLSAALRVPVSEFFEGGPVNGLTDAEHESLRAEIWALARSLPSEELRKLLGVAEALWQEP